uniref:Protein MULTIPLE CHLOROPLAST DIVISION SITE 1 n=1 Tax=Nelumbo nucifera TaxID=4432 RepID=A0A822Z9W1_NELNU|nr:TPA_asm: hypothetical protein HUJ06_016185 [Nelumbo nucifera]
MVYSFRPCPHQIFQFPNQNPLASTFKLDIPAASMASISSLQFHSISMQPSIWASNHRISANVLEFRTNIRFDYNYLNWNTRKLVQHFPVRVYGSSANFEDKRGGDEVESKGFNVGSENLIGRLQSTISSIPSVIFVMKRKTGTNFAIGLCIVIAIFVVAVREFVARKSRKTYHGSVNDLVKRGQLRSDRRGISRPLKYDDPFNNPLVKVSKGNSTIEMCGKVYRLAPVTLTEEQQSSHQKRRSRAYQWKRPKVFLKEGDSIPPDVDPDTVRWIPANHPFATTVSDIDEDLAQNNVYQKHGVPFRIQAEHEALQRKLEALQNEQKLNKLVIDHGTARDFERPFRSLSTQEKEQKPSDNQGSNCSPSKSDRTSNLSETSTPLEEQQGTF